MQKKKIALKDAVAFHGHLGPYLVLGLLAGECALKELKCDKYFGVRVKVWGASEKPKSCLIDGLQLSTGATFGKGNIEKLHGQHIEVEIARADGANKIFFTLRSEVQKALAGLLGHDDSEKLARRLYKIDGSKIFHWRLV